MTLLESLTYHFCHAAWPREVSPLFNMIFFPYNPLPLCPDPLCNNSFSLHNALHCPTCLESLLIVVIQTLEQSGGTFCFPSSPLFSLLVE